MTRLEAIKERIADSQMPNVSPSPHVRLPTEWVRDLIAVVEAAKNAPRRVDVKGLDGEPVMIVTARLEETLARLEEEV